MPRQSTANDVSTDLRYGTGLADANTENALVPQGGARKSLFIKHFYDTASATKVIVTELEVL